SSSLSASAQRSRARSEVPSRFAWSASFRSFPIRSRSSPSDSLAPLPRRSRVSASPRSFLSWASAGTARSSADRKMNRLMGLPPFNKWGQRCPSPFIRTGGPGLFTDVVGALGQADAGGSLGGGGAAQEEVRQEPDRIADVECSVAVEVEEAEVRGD